MDDILSTVDQVIDALGGTSATARLARRDPRAVSNWRARKKISADTFLVLTAELERIGRKAAPALWGMQEGGGAS